MTRLAALLIGGLLAGCSAAPEKPGIAGPAAISRQDLEGLRTLLRDAPGEAREALLAEAEARLIARDGASRAHVAADGPAASAVLRNILLTTYNPGLLPDGRFGLIDNAANGGGQPAGRFAAALADYFSNPAFGCQQPLFSRYFQQRYPKVGSSAPCAEQVPFYVISRYEGARPIWIDPRRVRSIHLLFAGSGDGIASRFGHVALRLVICPEIQSPAAACDANLSEHLVLGFGAHINDLELDTLKALKGEYHAYLFAGRFMDAYQDYAIGEFREIYSLPLRLSAENRERMVRELAQIHWGYSDQYHFFSRNCTGLLQQALRAVWPEFATSRPMQTDYIRPDHFFSAVRESSLAEGARLSPLVIAERDGYHFSSTRPFYQTAVVAIRRKMASPAFSDVDGYLQIDPGKRRLAFTEDHAFLSAIAHDRHLLDAQLMLEELAVIRSERELMAKAARYFHDDFPSRAKFIRARLDAGQAATFDECLIEPLKLIVKPMPRFPGIPDAASIPVPAVAADACQTPEKIRHLKTVLAQIAATGSAHWQKISTLAYYWAESINNVLFLKREGAGKTDSGPNG